MTELRDYFHPPLVEQALDRYAKVANTRGWGISHKLEMYNWAKAAFDSNLSPYAQQREFGYIYDNLKGGWKVFRNAQGGYWTKQETFEALTKECQTVSRQSGLKLTTLIPESPESWSLLADLGKLRNLKRTNWYPWMPVSKFTHFFNPALFPIYDTEVIWNKVLNGVFRRDYRQWCESCGVAPLETDQESARFNLTYTLMAGDAIRSADAGFMDFFAHWFKEQMSGDDDAYNVLDEIGTYYATAFEFVAIGAAHI